MKTRQLVTVIAALLALTLFTFTSALAQEVTLEPTPLAVVTATPDAVATPIVDAPPVQTIETTPIVAGIVAVLLAVFGFAGVIIRFVTSSLMSVQKTDKALFDHLANSIPPTVFDAYQNVVHSYTTLAGVIGTATDFIPGTADDDAWEAINNALIAVNGDADKLFALAKQAQTAANALTPTDSGNAVG